jgi:hypothetical protein
VPENNLPNKRNEEVTNYFKYVRTQRPLKENIYNILEHALLSDPTPSANEMYDMVLKKRKRRLDRAT